MAISKVWISLLLALAVVLSAAAARAEEAASEEATPVEEVVLTMGADNFDDAIDKHPFILVEFYGPWCGHCKSLATEYEKAAELLSKHDPPIVLARVDANDEKNKPITSKYEIQGFPTLKI